MARYENGVLYYTIGYARVKVGFANCDVCCNNCEFCFKDRSQERCKCRLMHDKIIPIEAVRVGVLPDCPIEFAGEFEPPTFEPPEE